MQRKRIVHLRDSSGIFGAERVILTLAKNIDPKKFSLMLLCLKRKGVNSDALIHQAKQIGVEVQTVDVAGKIDFKAISKIREILLENKVDIVHSHDFKSDFYALLSTRKTYIKRISTAHGSTKDSFLKRLYLFLNERLVYSYFHCIIVVSKDLFTILNKKGIPKSKLKIIQNGLDFSLLENNKQVNLNQSKIEIPANHKVFAVIGRIFPDKGHRFFIEAFARLREKHPMITGLIVGDGPSMGELRKHIDRLNLEENIILCGVRSDMHDIYKRIDCLVIPSLREGLPYVLLEAMACKVPVIATPVGDIPLLLQENETGYLVPTENIDTLAERMTTVLEEPGHIKELADSAYHYVQQKYSASNMVAKTENLYNEL